MTSGEFAEAARELRFELGEAVTAFLARRNLQPDWIVFYRETSIDFEQATREILCYAGNMWPEMKTADTERVG